MREPDQLDHELDAMRKVNIRQRSYYERGGIAQDQGGGVQEQKPAPDDRNFATKQWSRLRHGVGATVRRGIGLSETVESLHREWLGDLSDKRVLDLGCNTGNPLSLYLARESREYLGVDLSSGAIAILQRRIEEFEGARAVCVDFLDTRFEWGRFDVVYAMSVVHHFRYLEPFLRILNERTEEGGAVITYDPLKTSKPVRLARALYRPFQSDSEWEWPLDEAAMQLIDRHFHIDRVQGLLGKSKWAIPIAAIAPGHAHRLGRRWHQKDLLRANEMGPHLYRCMHVTMRLIPRKAGESLGGHA